MATMKQIAEIAGVSRGTVDRVLNQRGAVRPETERRILEVAEALNYTPNTAARNLSFAKQHLKLGCILFRPDKIEFFKQIVEGIEQKRRELQQYSVTVEVRYSDFNNPASQDELMDELVSIGVSGIALFGFNQESTRAKIAELAEKGIPVVTSNTDIPESGRIAYVGCDYIRSGRIAGKLVDLCLKGQGSVAVVQGAHRVLCLEGRLTGFVEYLSEKAPQVKIVDVKRNNQDDFTMFSAVKDLLDAHPDLGALLVDAGNSFGACRAVEMFSGVQRPSVICYDCSAKTVEMLQKGVITATITQEPQLQGSIPLDILLQYLGTGARPEKEFYYTELGIKIAENL